MNNKRFNKYGDKQNNFFSQQGRQQFQKDPIQENENKQLKYKYGAAVAALAQLPLIRLNDIPNYGILGIPESLKAIFEIITQRRQDLLEKMSFLKNAQRNYLVEPYYFGVSFKKIDDFTGEIETYDAVKKAKSEWVTTPYLLRLLFLRVNEYFQRKEMAAQIELSDDLLDKAIESYNKAIQPQAIPEDDVLDQALFQAALNKQVAKQADKIAPLSQPAMLDLEKNEEVKENEQGIPVPPQTKLIQLISDPRIIEEELRKAPLPSKSVNEFLSDKPLLTERDIKVLSKMDGYHLANGEAQSESEPTEKVKKPKKKQLGKRKRDINKDL